jgi:hypothetical protein
MGGGNLSCADAFRLALQDSTKGGLPGWSTKKQFVKGTKRIFLV